MYDAIHEAVFGVRYRLQRNVFVGSDDRKIKNFRQLLLVMQGKTVFIRELFVHRRVG